MCWHTSDTIRKPGCGEARQDASLAPAFVYLHHCHWAGRHSVAIQSSTASGEAAEREREKTKSVSHSSVQQCSHTLGKHREPFFTPAHTRARAGRHCAHQASFSCSNKSSQLHQTPRRASLSENCLSRAFKTKLSVAVSVHAHVLRRNLFSSGWVLVIPPPVRMLLPPQSSFLPSHLLCLIPV